MDGTPGGRRPLSRQQKRLVLALGAKGLIRSPKEAFWSLDDAKDMALAAARAWRQGPAGGEVEG
jgi:hypothetical protein